MTYRIRRYSKYGKRYIYFAGNICENNNHWVLEIRESFIYKTLKDAKKDIKKYNLKNVEVYNEE